MPEVSDTPAGVRPFKFHGLDLRPSSGTQYQGPCPWCDKDKFYVDVKTGKWDCKVCLFKGNPIEFLRKVHAASPLTGTEELARDRGLLSPEMLSTWGVCKSFITGEVLVPSYGPTGALVNLYRYAAPSGGGKRVLLGTAGVGKEVLYATESGGTVSGDGLFGPDRLSRFPHAKEVYVCEGPWDGMVLHETMRSAKRGPDGRLTLTGNPEVSLAADAVVVAVPGASYMTERWAQAFAGKRVTFLYDNDHPRPGPNGSRLDGAGLAGTKRACSVLYRSSQRFDEVRYLKWGEEGHDPELSNGHDLRDWLGWPDKISLRVECLENLFGRLEPIPPEWITGGRKAAAAVKPGSTELPLLPCTSWRELIPHWRRAMRWPRPGHGLDHGLACCLAVVTSTMAVGDQLWIKVIGAPSSGKTTIVEGLAVNRRYVYSKDSMTGLFSGFQVDAEGKEDLSMIKKVNGKTLVIKDADTLIQNPARTQIMSQFRAMYDRALRTEFKNRRSSDYEGLSVSVIICGTDSLYQMDTAELGERFLDVRVTDGVDVDSERATGIRAILDADQSIALEVNCSPMTQESPEKTAAKQYTGGFVEYLRGNAQSLIAGVRVTEGDAARLTDLGLLVAHLRGRPSSAQDTKHSRELCYRLGKQFHRLAKCLAVVLGKTEIDDDVWHRVRKVALDTCKGRMFDLLKAVIDFGPDGCEGRGVGMVVGRGTADVNKDLRYLRDVGACETFVPSKGGTAKTPRYRVSGHMAEIYESVVNQ